MLAAFCGWLVTLQICPDPNAATAPTGVLPVALSGQQRPAVAPSYRVKLRPYRLGMEPRLAGGVARPSAAARRGSLAPPVVMGLHTAGTRGRLASVTHSGLPPPFFSFGSAKKRTAAIGSAKIYTYIYIYIYIQ